jgi:DNA-binding Lrp family transcriptional regulator
VGKNININSHMINIIADIDKIDKKILYHLDSNSRQSYSQISKKINQPKTKIVYIINQLQKKEFKII